MPPEDVDRIVREAQAMAATGADADEARPLLRSLAGGAGDVALRRARASLLEEMQVAENQSLVRHATRLLNAALRS